MREAVTLKLDRIDADESPRLRRQLARPQGAKPDTSRLDAAPVPVKLVGHMEIDGDVVVQAGDWLGGDDRQIEGFAIQWPRRPAKVDISYGCSVKGIGRLPDGVVGEFVGTRQQARGITGITFCLVGEDAPSYSLIVEAMFSDGTQFGPQPAPVEFMGPTGREHLVGLSVNLKKVTPSAEISRRPAQRSGGANVPQTSSRQVRVFRAPKSSSQTHQR